MSRSVLHHQHIVRGASGDKRSVQVKGGERIVDTKPEQDRETGRLEETEWRCLGHWREKKWHVLLIERSSLIHDVTSSKMVDPMRSRPPPSRNRGQMCPGRIVDHVA